MNFIKIVKKIVAAPATKEIVAALMVGAEAGLCFYMGHEFCNEKHQRYHQGYTEGFRDAMVAAQAGEDRCIRKMEDDAERCDN